jgi:hypothetical protein
MGVFDFQMILGLESKEKCQLNLAFFLREPARGGERGVPSSAPFTK